MLKVNELFTGIGAFRKALINLDIPHEIVGISEIDIHAIKSYEAMYGKTKNYGDISKVDRLEYADLWTYGFPCQDISSAGLQKGIIKGETRSGLLYEVQRLLAVAESRDELPKYLIMENVKNLVQKKFIGDFESWLDWLEELGYNNYWQVLNASHFGIPHLRERVFAVSIRKDIDTGFSFPVDCGATDKSFMEYLDEDISAEELKEVTLDWKDLKKMKDFGAEYSFGGNVYNKPIYRCITANYGRITGNSAKFWRGDRLTMLTPKECWRLMGFSDEDFEKAEKVNDNPKNLYHQAGNSIVVNVLEEIIKELNIPEDQHEPVIKIPEKSNISSWLDALLA